MHLRTGVLGSAKPSTRKSIYEREWKRPGNKWNDQQQIQHHQQLRHPLGLSQPITAVPCLQRHQQTQRHCPLRRLPTTRPNHRFDGAGVFHCHWHRRVSGGIRHQRRRQSLGLRFHTKDPHQLFASDSFCPKISIAVATVFGRFV